MCFNWLLDRFNLCARRHIHKAKIDSFRHLAQHTCLWPFILTSINVSLILLSNFSRLLRTSYCSSRLFDVCHQNFRCFLLFFAFAFCLLALMDRQMVAELCLWYGIIDFRTCTRITAGEYHRKIKFQIKRKEMKKTINFRSNQTDFSLCSSIIRYRRIEKNWNVFWIRSKIH